MWMPGINLLSQIAHVGWGCLIVLAIGLRWGWLVAFIVLTAWVLPKEYGFDILVEGDTALSGTFDAAMYYVGGTLAVLWWLFVLADGKFVEPFWDNWRAGCISGVGLTLFAELVFVLAVQIWNAFWKR